MKDANGKDVTVGARAVVLSAGLGLKGKIGDVRDVRDKAFGRNVPLARVTHGDEGDPEWSAWLTAKDLAVL